LHYETMVHMKPYSPLTP